MADRAELCWEEDRMRAVEEIAARLPKDPSRTASRLRETSQGCRWILARWTALSVPLIENTPWNEDQCNLAARLMGVGPDLRASHPTLNPSASPADQADVMCEQADAVEILMADALEPLDAKEQELTRLGYCLRPSKEFLRLQRSESKLRKVYNEALAAFRQVRAEQAVASEPITCLTPDPEPIRLASSLIPTLATESEPDPEPESTADSDSPFEGKPIMAMLAALVESISQASESEEESESEPPPPAPPAPPVSLTSALPKPPAAPLNRKARRAREKAARKLQGMAR
jgi:hypothetical protein